MVQPIHIKPYPFKELAILYGVDSRTFKTWLVPFNKQLGEKIGRYYMIAQVKVIFEKLDMQMHYANSDIPLDSRIFCGAYSFVASKNAFEIDR